MCLMRYSKLLYFPTCTPILQRHILQVTLAQIDSARNDHNKQANVLLRSAVKNHPGSTPSWGRSRRCLAALDRSSRSNHNKKRTTDDGIHEQSRSVQRSFLFTIKPKPASAATCCCCLLRHVFLSLLAVPCHRLYRVPVRRRDGSRSSWTGRH